MGAITKGGRKLSGNRLGHWSPSTPTAAPKHPKGKPNLSLIASDAKPKVVYLPSCASRTMGPARGAKRQQSLQQVTEKLLQRAGYDVIYPDDLNDQCCGMPFKSKGLFDQAEQKADQTIATIMEASQQGKYPVYCDTSPCVMRLKERLSTQDNDLALFEPVEFIHNFILDRLPLKKQKEPVAVHITCSATRLGLADKTLAIMKACSENVVVPEHITCCGFAGDKGFTTPELNTSALGTLAGQVSHCEAGYSTSRTCEIGLSEHSGIDYQSIIYLVDECSA